LKIAFNLSVGSQRFFWRSTVEIIAFLTKSQESAILMEQGKKKGD
jgi:hypothetical protein